MLFDIETHILQFGAIWKVVDTIDISVEPLVPGREFSSLSTLAGFL